VPYWDLKRKIVDVMRFMDERGLKWACRYLEESYELAVRALERLGLQRFLDLYEKLEVSYVECTVDEARAKRNYRLKLRGWRSGISLDASLRSHYNLKGPSRALLS